MSKTTETWQDARVKRMASSLIIAGRVCFWVQLVFLIAVALLGGYVLKVMGGGGAGLGNILSFLGLALPLFTTLWCRHYASLGKKLDGYDRKPGPARIRRSLWIGIIAGGAGTVVTMLSLFGAASSLMLTMLANPQVGVPVAQVTTPGAPYQISAVDAVSLMALLLTQAAEMMVVAVSLYLAYLLSKCVRTAPAA
ncbi:DUF3611 family protein [Poseidonocella sp. HB161398]|uniref:DUF3611 family protein n=1 Tax=Poseidonocella sp. HB161398 TaxID=2320855 RepID=UPI001109938F|nr:DUF3611 family protein [Poseidonocella sp. HB161398]